VTVTSFELTFEIDAPEIVGGCGNGYGVIRQNLIPMPNASH